MISCLPMSILDRKKTYQCALWCPCSASEVFVNHDLKSIDDFIGEKRGASGAEPPLPSSNPGAPKCTPAPAGITFRGTDRFNT